MTLRPLPLILAAAFLSHISAYSVTDAFAQEGHCDTRLRTGNDPNAYRLRNDRCEGVYIKEVAASTLVVASLTDAVDSFDPLAGENLQLKWLTPGNESVHLRASSLRRRFYYQMDSRRPANKTSYSWPTDVLRALKLTKNELGIVATTSYQLGNAKRQIYLPLGKQQQNPKSPNAYRLVLLPGVELSEVYISLAPVKADGSPGVFIKSDQPVRLGYYPAERGIVIPIKDLKTPGFYYLAIGATLRAGGSATAQVWFYHSK